MRFSLRRHSLRALRAAIVLAGGVYPIAFFRLVDRIGSRARPWRRQTRPRRRDRRNDEQTGFMASPFARKLRSDTPAGRRWVDARRVISRASGFRRRFVAPARSPACLPSAAAPFSGWFSCAAAEIARQRKAGAALADGASSCCRPRLRGVGERRQRRLVLRGQWGPAAGGDSVVSRLPSRIGNPVLVLPMTMTLELGDCASCSVASIPFHIRYRSVMPSLTMSLELANALRLDSLALALLLLALDAIVVFEHHLQLLVLLDHRFLQQLRQFHVAQEDLVELDELDALQQRVGPRDPSRTRGACRRGSAAGSPAAWSNRPPPACGATPPRGRGRPGSAG